jgi:hypothetical protein
VSVVDGVRRHYGLKAWWGALVMRSEMRHLGGIVDQTYLPILRLVADDPEAIAAEWAAVRAQRSPIRRFDSPHTYWRKTYGNFVRELDWAFRELHARLPEPTFEDLVVTTMGERLDAWIGWMKRWMARVDARTPGGLGPQLTRPASSRATAMMWAATSPIVGEVDVRGVEDGAVVLVVPECAMHTVVSDTTPQTYACLYGCKAACEAFLGPDDPVSIHFEPNLPALDCVMRVGVGTSGAQL